MSIDTEHQTLEITQMIVENNLDVRIVTMGLPLLDRADSDVAQACTHIEERIMGVAARLMVVADEVAAEFGMPVINK